MFVKNSADSPRAKLFSAFLFFLTALLIFVSLLLPMLSELLSSSLQAGDVAAQDFRAPRSITYVSEVLTEERRDSAERSVGTVYTAPNTSISRQQLEKLRGALNFINSVRSDKYATSAQRLDDLAALEDVRLSAKSANDLLALSDSRWQAVQQESIKVLEDVMRTTIRTDRVEEARSSVTNLVSLSMPEQQAAIVAELAAAFVTPNSLPSETLTEAARQQAREVVQPVSRTFIAGQTVVLRGQVLKAEDVEALSILGLGVPRRGWQDFLSPAILTVLIVVLAAFYLRSSPYSISDPRSLALISVLFLAFLFGARITIPEHTVIPYAYPVAGYGLVVAALFGAELALMSALPLALLVTFGLPNAMDLTAFYTMGTLFGVLALGNARRLMSFFWAGLAVALAGVSVVWAYRLPLPATDWLGLLTLTGAALFSGLAAASLALVLQYFTAQVLGMSTPMQLMDLTRPDHPLLQALLRDAPGTYQHSLQVSNLAEQAAERVGADTLLTRVGALYHDIGKTLNPVFFIENQVDGMLNPHDDLDPVTSAQTIIRHVTDGLELGRKHRLPRRILDFISEHHGTMVTRYQYVKAVNAAQGDESQVDIEKFRYPGPRPQSRETAILLLADGCEAGVRAEKPKDEAALEQLIKNLIENRVAIGELNDTDLTLRDINQITRSFIATLRGVYHPRVQYPKLEKPAVTEEPTRPLLSSSRTPVEKLPVETSTEQR